MPETTQHPRRHLYTAGISIALLILLSIGILTYHFLHLKTNYSQSVVYAHLVMENFQKLLTYLVDAETGQRGFIITGKDNFLEPYNSALHNIDAQLTELKKLTSDNPSQQKNLDTIQTLIDHRLASLKVNIDLRRKAGINAVADTISNGIGKAIMDSIRIKVANAQNQETYLLSERTRDYQLSTNWLNLILVCGAIAGILVLLVIIFLLMHENALRTRVEKELRTFQKHLNVLVEERTNELKASEQRWVTTLASLGDAVIATDETGCICFMNPAAELTTGWTVKEALGKHVYEVFKIVNEKRRQPVEDYVDRVIKEGVVNDLADHTVLIRKDGTELPIDNSGSRIQQEDGTLMGIVVVFHDSTPHKQAQEALRNQAALLNFAHDAIFVRDADDKITFWSRGAEETYGWAPEEASGRDINDLLKTRYLIPLVKINEEAQNTGEWNGELVHTRKDGQEIVVASRWALQRDIWGRHVSTLEINRDITELKKLEEARSQLSAIVEHAEDAIFSKTLDGIITSWNQGAQRMYGYTECEVKGKPVSVLMPPGHEDEMPEILEKVRIGEAVRDVETVRMRKDGTTFMVTLTVSPVKNLQGTIIGASTIAHDITERKRAEQALRESEAKFRRIFDSNLLAIAFWRSDGYLTDANEAVCRLLGCTREEVLSGKVSWQDQTPPEIVWRDLQAIDEVKAKGVCKPYEKRFIHRDGHTVPVLIGGASIGVENQGVTYIVDLTQQKEYEKSLKEAQKIAELRAKEAEEGKRMLEALMENVPEGISISDSEGNIFMVSKYGRNLLGGFHAGMKIEEVTRSWKVFRPDGRTVMPIEELPLVRALRDETVRDIEILEMDSEGRKLPLLCNAAPIHNDGKVVNGIVVWRDITALKKAETARRESERNLEAAQKISHVGSWIWNTETGELLCTAETFRIYGEEPFSFHPTIDKYLTYVHPDDCDFIKSIIADLQAGRTQRLNHEFRIIRKDGSVRFIHSIGETIEFTADGKPHLIRGTGQDITERKQAQEALRASESRLRLAQQVAHFGSFEYDLVNSRSKWSPELEALHGLNPGEYRGGYEQWKSFVYHDDLRDVERHLGEAMETGQFETEWRIVRRDGAIRWLAARGQVFKDNAGRPVRMIGVNLDITERKNVENLLRQREERLVLATNAAQLGIFEWDIKSGISIWDNPRMFEIFGLSTQDPPVSREQFEREVIHPDDLPQFRQDINESMRKRALFEGKYRIRRLNDQKWRWIGYLARFEYDENDQVIRLIGVISDITERKEAEEALQRYTEELAAANRDLESFSYSVSHDLRNPLGLINGFASILSEEYSERLDEEGRDYLRRINDSVGKMQTLINDMLTLSRIGRQEMKRADVNLSATVRNFLTELKGTNPDRKVEFYIEENVHVNADPRLIHLALENLLRNAWKFTSKKENTRIEFGTMIIDRKTVYFIRDNGAGFDMKFAQKIFEPFKRVHAEKEFGGTGVGLSIVHRVLERHGGKVWAEGEVGKGATFYFTVG